MKNKKGGIEAIKRRYGYLFVAPWILGIALFVLIPIITFFYYSFSDVAMTPEGLQTTFVGLKHYKYVFLEYPYYSNIFLSSLSSLVTSLPIVVALSMILALVLNQNFRGRTLARAVFFLPVIIASSAVMEILTNFNMNQGITAAVSSGDTKQAAEFMEVIDFAALLDGLNLPGKINDLVLGYLNDTFNLIWSCGVQTLLFIAGLQTIPDQLYEVGKVEGATIWESFWYITVPMLSRVILLVLFYTMVELFIDNSAFVDAILEDMRWHNIYDSTSARLWIYFAGVGIVIGLVMLLYKKLVLKRVN